MKNSALRNQWTVWEPRLPWVFLGLGALLRLILWPAQTIPSVDGTAYLRIAEGFTQGTVVATVHQYGYPALIALAGSVTGDLILAARGLALVSGLLLIPLTWFVARRAGCSVLASMIPTVGVTAMPLVLRYSLTTMTETPYLALVTGSLLLVLRKREFLGGVLGGLAYAIRPEALLITGIAALARWRHPKRALRVVAGLFLVTGLYIGTLGVVTGVWTLSQKTVDLGAGTWSENEKVVGEEHLPPDLAGRLKAYGEDVVRTYPKRALQVAGNVVRHGGWPAAVLAPAALLPPGSVVAGGTAYLVFLPATFIGERARYIVPALPFVWLMTAVVLSRIGRKRLRHTLWGLCVAGLALTAIQDRALYTENEDGNFPELVDAGKWLLPHAGPNRVVYDRKPYTAFYAKAQTETVPRGEYHAIIDEVVAKGGDFLVVHDGVAKAFRPELLPLIADQGTMLNDPRLVPVYYEAHPRGYRTAIYRVVRPGGPPPIPGEAAVRERIREEAPHAPFHDAHATMAIARADWPTVIAECELALAEGESLELRLVRIRAMMEAGYPPERVRAAVAETEPLAGTDPTARIVLDQARNYIAGP